jgi:anti-sigma factor RsiW
MPSHDCVPEEQLRAFLLGDLPEGPARAVAGHLEGCPDCEAAARRLDGLADPLLRSLRRALAPEEGRATPVIVGQADGGSIPDPPRPIPGRVGGYELLAPNGGYACSR